VSASTGANLQKRCSILTVCIGAQTMVYKPDGSDSPKLFQRGFSAQQDCKPPKAQNVRFLNHFNPIAKKAFKTTKLY